MLDKVSLFTSSIIKPFYVACKNYYIAWFFCIDLNTLNA